MKKAISILLAVLIVCSLSAVAFAGSQSEFDIPDPGPGTPPEEEAQIDPNPEIPEEVKDLVDELSNNPKSNEEVAELAGEEEVEITGWFGVTKGVKTYTEEELANLVCVLFIAEGSTEVVVLEPIDGKVTFPSAGIAAEVIRVVESPAA
ncbi:MAG: hypothetical protein K6C12_14945 [Oscillospiraceae bacterium]|nr:hypothetical protein [Oscillospiraceae bacterium]